MNKFKQLLKDSRLTQLDLAKKIGKSQRLISRWCCGTCQPQIRDLVKVQEVLNIDINDLLNCFI